MSCRAASKSTTTETMGRMRRLLCLNERVTSKLAATSRELVVSPSRPRHFGRIDILETAFKPAETFQASENRLNGAGRQSDGAADLQAVPSLRWIVEQC